MKILDLNKKDLELLLLILGLMHIGEPYEDYLSSEQNKRVNDLLNYLEDLDEKDKEKYSSLSIKLAKEIFKEK